MEHLRSDEREFRSSEMRLVFVRHASKDVNGLLSEEGRLEAADFWNKFFSGEVPEIVNFYHSDILRSKETVEMMLSAFVHNVGEVRQMDDLSEEPYSDENISKLGLDGGKWLQGDFIHSDLPSSKLLAGRLARIICDFFDNFSSSNIDIDELNIFVSHVPPLMLFARWVLEKELGLDLVANEEILIKMGGFTKVLHGFEILVRKNKEAMEVKMIFDKFIEENSFDKLEFDLDIDHLRVLSEIVS